MLEGNSLVSVVCRVFDGLGAETALGPLAARKVGIGLPCASDWGQEPHSRLVATSVQTSRVSLHFLLSILHLPREQRSVHAALIRCGRKDAASWVGRSKTVAAGQCS